MTEIKNELTDEMIQKLEYYDEKYNWKTPNLKQHLKEFYQKIKNDKDALRKNETIKILKGIIANDENRY